MSIVRYVIFRVIEYLLSYLSLILSQLILNNYQYNPILDLGWGYFIKMIKLFHSFWFSTSTSYHSAILRFRLGIKSDSINLINLDKRANKKACFEKRLIKTRS